MLCTTEDSTDSRCLGASVPASPSTTVSAPRRVSGYKVSKGQQQLCLSLNTLPARMTKCSPDQAPVQRWNSLDKTWYIRVNKRWSEASINKWAHTDCMWNCWREKLQLLQLCWIATYHWKKGWRMDEEWMRHDETWWDKIKGPKGPHALYAVSSTKVKFAGTCAGSGQVWI